MTGRAAGGTSRRLAVGWLASVGAAVGVRTWNAFFGPLFYGYDAWGHVSYVFFIDMFRALPYADQGWSYFHPPLHYVLAWPFMLFGDAHALVVGLALIGSLASLGVAALAATVVRWAMPDRPALVLLAFTAVALLPVHVYTSPMPGNELTAAFTAAAAVAAFLANERRERPTRIGDCVTGALAGFALLAKFTNVVPCMAIAAALGLRALRSSARGEALARNAARGLLIAAVALVVAGPWYARNVVTFGNPLMTSADWKDVARIQAAQPPGERSVLDYVRIPAGLLEDSAADAEHMLGSVWANTYLNVWFDTYRESQLPLPRFPTRLAAVHQLTLFFAVLGLVPTLVAAIGAVASARVVLRRRDAVVDETLLLLAAGSLAAFVAFTLRVPTWAALKASYLLNLSLPFALFVARGGAALARRGGVLAAVAPIGVGALAVATTLFFATGLMLRLNYDSHQYVSVEAHFGEFDGTRALFREDAPKRSYLEARAAVELYDGQPAEARRFYLLANRFPLDDPAERPYFENRLAVANAFAGAVPRALGLLDRAIARDDASAVLHANRGALRVFTGAVVDGETDLRAALSRDDSLEPAWRSLAAALALQGRSQEAAEASMRADAAARRVPRGFPYGVGTGYLDDSGAGQRFLLQVDVADAASDAQPRRLALRIHRPPRARNHSPRSPVRYADARPRVSAPDAKP